MIITLRKNKLPLFLFRERRKAPRASLCETLFLDYRIHFDDNTGVGEGMDISTAGIRFISDSTLPEGTRLNLTLYLYPAYLHARAVPLQGQVVRCYKEPGHQHCRVACAFDRLEESELHTIDSFIDWVKERQKRSSYL